MNIAWKYPTQPAIPGPITFTVAADGGALPMFGSFTELDVNGNPLPPGTNISASAAPNGNGGYEMTVRHVSQTNAQTFLELSFQPFPDGSMLGPFIVEIDWTGVDATGVVFSVP